MAAHSCMIQGPPALAPNPLGWLVLPPCPPRVPTDHGVATGHQAATFTRAARGNYAAAMKCASDAMTKDSPVRLAAIWNGSPTPMRQQPMWSAHVTRPPQSMGSMQALKTPQAVEVAVASKVSGAHGVAVPMMERGIARQSPGFSLSAAQRPGRPAIIGIANAARAARSKLELLWEDGSLLWHSTPIPPFGRILGRD